MEVSYNKLWKLMIDKGMQNKSDLRKVTGIGTNTLAKFGFIRIQQGGIYFITVMLEYLASEQSGIAITFEHY